MPNVTNISAIVIIVVNPPGWEKKFFAEKQNAFLDSKWERRFVFGLMKLIEV